jgi:hypothetical protein
MWIHVNEVLNQAMARLTRTVADFLPGLLASLTILFFAIILALIVRVMIRRSLERIHFDVRTEHWGFAALAEWSPDRSPSHLIARVVFWTIVALGLLLGVSALDVRLTSMLAIRLFGYLPNVAAAVVVLAVGVILSRFLARSVLISAVNMHIQSARLVSLGVKWLVLVLTLAMALDHLKIGGQIVELSFAILLGGIVLALALAIGLGSQDMVRRSWDRQADRSERMDRETEEHLHHF